MKKIVPLTLLILVFTYGTISLPRKNTTASNSETEEKIEENEDKSLIKVEEHNYTYYWYQTHHKSFWISTSDVAGPIANVLRDSYLFGHPIGLKDYFIFYGHRIKEVLVTTGGFLYMDEMTHRQLTYSQYIAPLMANFETKTTNDTISTIKYFSNSTILIVWWNNMKLRHSKYGDRFTFQLVYRSNGSIFFNYDKIPETTFKLLKEGESLHKVTVGLSDAYYLFEDTGGKAMHISVVFEYHHLSIPLDDVLQYKSIEIKALPSCIEHKTCESCTGAKVSSKLDCQWCPTAQLCSDGFDRMRQKWLEHDCNSNGFVSSEKCSTLVPMNKSDLKNLTRVRQFNLTDDEDEDDYEDKIMALKDEIKFSAALLGCGVLLFLALWLLYALKYPNSASGRWLIEHRPTKLIERCRRGFLRRVGHRGRTETYVSFDREMNNDMVL